MARRFSVSSFLRVVVPLLLALPARAGAAPAPASTEVGGDRRLLVMELQHGGEVTADLAHTLTELVTIKLSELGAFYVISGSEITQVAVLESEKQKLGCEENSCLAELAEALGARYVVFGRASTLGELHVVQLRLFDASTAQFVERVTVESRTIEELTARIPASLERLVAPVLAPGRSGTDAAAPAAAASAEAGSGPSLLLIAGVGALGLGTLAALGTLGGTLYFNGVVADPAGTDKSAARASGLAVLIGGGVSTLALLITGALLTGLGAVE
jgi:TolB-like protein